LSSKNQNQESVKKLFDKLTTIKLSEHIQRQKFDLQNLEFLIDGYFESKDYFRQRYIIEQRRAERKDYEFSIIIIDMNLEYIQQNNNRRQEKVIDNAKKMLFSICKVATRQTDVVAKNGSHNLLILLPDTDQQGGQFVIDKIRAELEKIADSSKKIIFRGIAINCYTYPHQKNEISAVMQSNIFEKKINGFLPERITNRLKSFYIKRLHPNSNDSIHRKSNPRFVSNDTLAIDNPYGSLPGILSCDFRGWQQFVKRGIDIVISSLALIIFSPVILLISLLIKLTSRGPIFFKQERIGFMGHRFIIYKFRTMYQQRDDHIHQTYMNDFISNNNKLKPNSIKSHPIYKIVDDPRVTPLGKFLRRTSLDEMGQLINVLKGEMSLVGPRPPIPYEVEMYDLWHHHRYLAVKPGMTGLWQIYGRNTTTFDDMVRLDIAYANNWSLFLDFKILFKTIGAVMSMKGAY